MFLICETKNEIFGKMNKIRNWKIKMFRRYETKNEKNIQKIKKCKFEKNKKSFGLYETKNNKKLKNLKK